MRPLSLALITLVLSSSALLAATITPEEAKLQVDFNKAYRVQDKGTRTMAVSTLEGAKHPSSWQLLLGVVNSDPEPEVRTAALNVLAKEPAHDSSLARMLVQILSGVKFNDIETRSAYAKIMSASEFKYDLSAALADQLTKLRYPDLPKYLPGNNGTSNQLAIKTATKARKDFEDMLEAFNAVAKSEITSPVKDSPGLVGRWWQANAQKIAAADKELAEKYKKEDLEAAKAAKEAAK